MLNFEIAKLRSVYVYILKVTTDYVYVTTTRSGLAYKPGTSTQGEYKGHSISKVRIHRSVSHAYSNLYLTREFSRPWLASLNYYGDEIVSIEIQRVNRNVETGYQDAANWQSSFSKVVPLLYDQIKEEKNVYVNGTEVFWPDEKSEDDEIVGESETGQLSYKNGKLHFSSPKELALDKDGFFTIRGVTFVRLASMGQSLSKDQKGQIKDEIRVRQDSENGDISKEDLQGMGQKATLGLQTGKVLSYYPNALHPQEERIHIYSPVLQSKKFNSAKQSSSSSKDYKPDEEKKVYFLASQANRAYANVEFAIKAAKTIGHLYGYEHTDDLNIQDIIQKTGEVNLMNIDEYSRKTMPIEMDAMTAIAYLFRFIYKEKEIKKLRDLSTMFRFCINRGLVYEQDISGDFEDGYSSVPLSTFSTSGQAA